jgi:hypothetical protein
MFKLHETCKKKEQLLTEEMGRCLAEALLMTFWFSFRYRSGYRLGHLAGSRKQ